MILLVAIVVGISATWMRARYTNTRLTIPELEWMWLVPIAFVPQWLAFYFQPTSTSISTTAASAGLITSQLLLLAFAWANRKVPGFWALGLGLGLNLLVIVLNGGLMPISPETVRELAPNAPSAARQAGERLGTTKDIVLPANATRLWWLSDRFVLPDWFSYRVAFSIGDIFVGVGAILVLWRMGE